MREFTKHVIQALAEDEWEMLGGEIRHIKSRLRIDTNDLRMRDTPIEFTWGERRLVKKAICKMLDRTAAEKFLIYRVNPKKPGHYSDTFL